MKIKYYNLLAGLLFFASCETDLPEVASPTFDVTTKSDTYKAGQVVTFDITGDAHVVSFYSGEPLKEFAYRNGRVVEAGNAGAKLSFTTAVVGGTQGTLSTTEPPQLRVMASTNFNGNYDWAGIQAATWTDITSRFRYSVSPTVFATSTVVDISDLIMEGKPIYIAFRYVTLPQATNGTARNWQVESFAVISNKDIGTTDMPVTPTITNLLGAGFRLVDQNPIAAPARSVLTATRISLLGNLYDAVNDSGNDPQSENWAISRPINTSSFDVGIDKASAIREQVSASALTSHTYTYTKPGVYKATFVASNLTKNDRKDVVREVTITVTAVN
jgi:hypothetical protein